MLIVETLTLRVGASVATALLKSWIGDSDLVKDIGSTVGELLAKAGLDFREQRRVSREVDEATEAIAERLAIFFESPEFSHLPESEREAAAIAVADTVQAGFIDPAIALRADLSAQQLERSLRASLPAAIQANAVDHAATHLYDIALREVCAYLVTMVENLPRFHSEAFAELLLRDRAIIEKLDEALDHLPSTSVEKALEFSTEYLREVARRFDQLQLFGLSGETDASRYKLSVAYLTLTAAVRQRDAVAKRYPSDALELEVDRLLDQGELAADESQDDAEPDDRIVRVDEVMASTRRLLIRGDAGSGKTTLLQWLAVNAARRSFPAELETLNELVPFVIQLRRYADTALPAPDDFVIATNALFRELAPTGWVTQLLKTGGAMVLVDGVDELRSERRTEVREWLEDLLAAFPDCTVVVTSRPPAVDEGWLDQADFDHCVLEPMGLSEVDKFITHWHDAVTTTASQVEQARLIERREQLKRVIRRNAPLRRLATSPLLCAMLCALNRKDEAQLPEERLELYQIALDALLQNRDAARRVLMPDLPSLSLSRKIVLLRELAYWLVRNGYTDAPRELAIEQTAKVLDRISPDLNAAPVFDGLLQRTGLLREPIEGRIDFIHRTFLEYLAALAVVDKGDIGVLVTHAEDDAWSEIIVLAAGCANHGQRHELIQRLLDQGDDGHGSGHRYHLLAVACLENVPELDPELTLRVEGALAALLPPGSIGEANQLAAAGTLAVPLLGPTLRMRAVEARASIRALSLIGTEEAMDQIARFGTDSRVTVTRELLRQWSRFDLEEYAQRVMADSPLHNGALAIGIGAPIGLTRCLRHLTDLTVERPITRDDVRVLSSLQLTALGLRFEAHLTALGGLGSYDTMIRMAVGRQSELSSLAGLGSYERLVSLELTECPHLTELIAAGESWPRALAQLSIRGAEVIDISNIASAQMTSLTLGAKYIESFETIAEMPSLRSLSVEGLDGDLSLYPLVDIDTLTTVRLSYCSGDIEPAPLGRDERPFPSLSLVRCPAFVGGRGLDSLGQVRDVYARNIGDISPAHLAPLQPEILRIRTDGRDLDGFPTTVRTACVTGPQLKDISGLAAAALEELYLCAPRLKDLQVLSELTSLKTLYIRTQHPDLKSVSELADAGCQVDIESVPETFIDRIESYLFEPRELRTL